MISARAVKYLFAAIVACGLLNSYLALGGKALGLAEFCFGVSFGIAFHCLIIVRLPIFRDYYYGDPLSLDQPHQGYANSKAAPPLSSLFSGGVAAALYALSGGNEVASFGACAGVAAGVMSFYMPNPLLQRTPTSRRR